MGRASILQAVCIHPLMTPRARDEPGAKHRLLWSTSWMVAWASRLFVRSRRHGLSLPCPWGRNGSGSVTPTQRKTSRTRCVWGNTVVPERPSPSQRARPFHSHSIQTPASPFSIAKGVQTQASPFHLSRGVHISLVFWVGHLFQPFFIIVWWLDCLFCRFPGPKPIVPSLAQVLQSRFTATGFLIHSVCPL